jgi:hypothetical protein
MKFNGYQEAAILTQLSSSIPHMDSTELWYGYIAPFFNEREISPNGAVKLAATSDELAQVLRILAADFMIRKVREYSDSPEEQEYLLSNLPQEALHEVARTMGNAISASMIAIRDTRISG